MKDESEWKTQLVDSDRYIITGFGLKCPCYFPKREAETLITILRCATPLIQVDLIRDYEVENKMMQQQGRILVAMMQEIIAYDMSCLPNDETSETTRAQFEQLKAVVAKAASIFQ